MSDWDPWTRMSPATRRHFMAMPNDAFVGEEELSLRALRALYQRAGAGGAEREIDMLLNIIHPDAD